MNRFELALFSAIMGVLLSLVAVVLWYLLNQPVPETRPAPEPTESYGPPIKNCPDDVALWDCIRDAMYRTDL